MRLIWKQTACVWVDLPNVLLFSFHHRHLVWVVFWLKQRGCRDTTEAPEGPLWPPAGNHLDRDDAFGHTSKCFHWWARNVLDGVPERGSSSQTEQQPKPNQAGSPGERRGFRWQQNVSCCESDSAVAGWAWIIEGLVMMRMMVVMAKRLCLLLPLLAADGDNRCFHPPRDFLLCDCNEAVTSPLQLDKLLVFSFAIFMAHMRVPHHSDQFVYSTGVIVDG